jgi:NH3-dependent NAD+ synthetase
MKNSIKKPILATVVLAILLGGIALLVGCSGGSSSSSTGAVTQSPSNVADTTLAGVDANNNGVRDDVEAYITAHYATQPKVRALLMQFAAISQKELLDAADKQKSIQHADDEGVFQDCLWYVADSTDLANAASDAVQAIVLNTKERMRAYLKYNDQLGGQVFSTVPDSELATTCGALIQNAPVSN